jgi:hypothetical protein
VYILHTLFERVALLLEGCVAVALRMFAQARALDIFKMDKVKQEVFMEAAAAGKINMFASGSSGDHGLTARNLKSGR